LKINTKLISKLIHYVANLKL